MKRLLLGLLLVCAFALPARSQGATVVTTCGTLPLAYAPGATRNPTVDVNGNTCSDSSGGSLAPGAATAANQALEIAGINSLVSGQIVAGTPITPGTATATQGVMLGCQYNSAGVTFTNLQQGAIPCGPTGALYVGGAIASGGADSGNPVKIGGVYNSTLPTFTNGQRGDIQIGTRGAQSVQIYSVDSATGMSGGTTSTDALATSGSANSLRVVPFNYQFNGSTWDRAFTCPSTAVVNVTAASTTEVVALTASQVIRVCSIAVSMTPAAGTVTFVSGTGTNCGSSTAAITGAFPLAASTPLTISSGNGSVIRTPSANALCVTATAANAVGVVTYAKY